MIILFLFSFNLYATEFNPETFKFKNGQILAISQASTDGSTFLFEVATGSRYGHIGIVMKQKGKVFVFESTPPNGVTKSPLKEFLKKSKIKKKYAATVLETNITYSQVFDLASELENLVKQKIPYNYKQSINPNSLNCSEFVHKAYKNIGIELSSIETLDDLNFKAFDGLVYDAFGFRFDKSARFISPASIVRSNKTKVLANNLPFNKVLTEVQILDAWIKSGSLKNAMYFLYPQTGQLSLIELEEVMKDELIPMLKSKASSKPYKILNCSNLIK
jgi:hypothetical protein